MLRIEIRNAQFCELPTTKEVGGLKVGHISFFLLSHLSSKG